MIDYRSRYHDRRQHDDMLRYLFRRDFYSLIPNDDNRVEDGISLRDGFEMDSGSILNFDAECTVLEALIGIASRMGYMLYDPKIDDDKQLVPWFWTLIKNLELAPRSQNIPEIIDIFLERKYDYNGDGGLFPLRFPKKDQRKVEIWYQMMAWIDEKMFKNELL